MRLLLSFFIAVVLLLSCSGPKLYSQGMNKISKAIQKDPSLSIPTDTLRVVEYDTIQGADGKDSLIIQTNTIQLPCDFDVEGFIASNKEKSRRELRHERNTSKDSLKHMEKMYKLETDRLEDSLSYQKKLNRELTKRLDDQTDSEVKIAKVENKSSPFLRFVGRLWWAIAIAGFIAGMYVRSKLPNLFKRTK